MVLQIERGDGTGLLEVMVITVEHYVSYVVESKLKKIVVDKLFRFVKTYFVGLLVRT